MAERLGKSLTRVLLPGGYAWLTTVALPVWDSGEISAVLVAILAIGALGLGVSQRRKRPVFSRRVGIVGFLGLCLGAWSLAAVGSLPVDRVPLRSAVGAIAWGLFAMGWGGLAAGEDEFLERTDGGPQASLVPRKQMPHRFWLALGVVAVLALALPIAAWGIDNSVDALLAHLLAAAACIALIGSGVRIVAGGSGARKSAWPMVLLLFWMALGALVEHFREGSEGLL